MANDTNESLLLSACQAAALCGVGRSLWYSLHSAGKVPMPYRLGRRTLWRRDELIDWINAGLPPRDRWQVMQANQDNPNSRRISHAT